MSVLDVHIVDTEVHTVLRKSFNFTVHFNRLFLSCNIDGNKNDHNAMFENTVSQRQYYRHQFCRHPRRTNPRLPSWMNWWQSFKQRYPTGIAIFTGDFPSPEPKHVCTWLQHDVTIPTRNWHKGHCVWVAASFLNVGADFLHDFLDISVTEEWPSGILLIGLTIFGYTCFKFTNTSNNNQGRKF